MSKRLKIVFIIIVVVNFIVVYSSSFPTVNALKSAPDNINKRIDIQDPILLKHGIPITGTFNSESTSHNYVFEALTQGQVVYFSINPKDNLNITIYTPSEIEFDIEEITHPDKYLGSWKASADGDWRLQVNGTESYSTNVTYVILASIPEVGYSDDTATLVNESIIEANFTIDHEIHHWKVTLEENQNCTLSLKETTPSVLYRARMMIYRQEFPKNPVLSDTQIIFNYSWNPIARDTYFIVITHNPEDVSPTGVYNISLVSEESRYSFETAERLPYNQTLSVRVDQGFAPRKPYFFKFEVNFSQSKVFLRVYGPNSTAAKVLDHAIVEVYDSGKQTREYIGEEDIQINAYEFNISLTLDAGTYYLVISPDSNAVGQFSIHFSYQLPQPFIWTLPAIFLNIAILIALPLYLIYLDSKGKWYRINQWTLPISLNETYKFLKYSFSGLFNIKEVPNESILIRVTSIPFKTFALLNFVESSEKETLVFSKRIKRKIEWIVYFLVGLIIFDVLNFLDFFLFSGHSLPIYISNLASLFVILAVPTILLAIIVFFVNIFIYISYSQLNNRITYIVQNYQESSNKAIPPSDMDPTQAWKSINYVRVLWNQAKHAFTENNYELFVIKADASVKNLVSTRYVQLVPGDKYSKPDFQFQVSSLRKRGFDLPNEKKITHFRNLRNRIVHSSVTLDEKESVDCFAYYSTFITRLGIRSS